MQCARRMLPALLCALTLATAATAQERASGLERTLSIRPAFEVAEQRVVDVDQDGRDDLLVIGVGGEVRVWRSAEVGAPIGEQPVGSLILPHPDRSLLAIAEILGDGGAPELVSLCPDGVVAYSVTARGAYSREGTLLGGKAKMRLRVGHPRFAEIARDVNGDARPDVILPRGESCELWLNAAAKTADAPPTLTRSARVPVDLERSNSTDAELLSDELESTFRVPRLAFADVNGDGRSDLVVEDGQLRAFHIQRDDGTLPDRPSVSLDLDIFKDSTPEATVRLGRTVSGRDRQRYESADLDGNGIPDYVIAHRRKVWVFHGGPSGPQFIKPSAVLKVSEDVTAMMLADLDRDGRKDLMLLRLQAPSAASIVRGLLAEWGVEVTAVGYANADGKTFAKEPRWRGEVELRLPSILSILRDADELVKRFDQIGKKYRSGVSADFDGDGDEDVALLGEDLDRLEVWRLDGHNGKSNARDIGATVAGIFFDDKNQVWDLDRVLQWLSGDAERRVAELSGGRPAAAVHRFLAKDGPPVATLAGDLSGDGSADIVLSFRESDGTARIDVLSLR